MAFYTRSTVYPPSRRNVKGKGAMKKDHRTNGEMWINIMRSWGGFSRGAYFNENVTIGEFVGQVVRDVSTEEGFQYFQEGWYVEVQSRRKALDPEDHVMMLKERFNGAERVTAKVFNEYGDAMTYTFGQGWH
ncbi:hypothetical protein C8F04DRAFT_1063707 [Mycena alexandri]|uniref:Uncharacterized protein n=1 Tax=Mycena alexandri TaxID=1745969 RepID=A0AAD6TJ36_9AGAR|nr:hypothetical protein C8F04DRAFT_1063645 [Mycena alexandri]KAJ7046230.1 hypothetical protein C8F04DRAFT_1063707 [Mycena alexandri]